MLVMLLLFVLKLPNMLPPQRHYTLKTDSRVCKIVSVVGSDRCCSDRCCSGRCCSVRCFSGRCCSDRCCSDRCCSALCYLFVCLLAVLWYAFVILNTLQGLFIFLAFTCTKKVCRGLRVQLGLRHDRQSQGPKSAVNTADTWT